jgi:hypothetical protein
MKRKRQIAKAIQVLAIVAFLAFVFDIILATTYLGETKTVDLTGIIQTLFFYLIGIALAILVIVYFWSYSGLRGIKILSISLIAIYGLSILTFPFSIGDTLEWTPLYFVYVLFILLLGLILAIWTMIYFKRMD